MGHPAVLVDFESGGVEGGKSLRVVIEESATIHQQHVREVIQTPLGGHSRFQLPHRARGRVPWIGKQREPLRLALFIHLLERAERHQQFAANFEIHNGTDRTFRTLSVTSPPTDPSPRVTPRASRPSSYTSASDMPSSFSSQT